MIKTISAINVRQKLGQVMNEVALKNDEYIVERAGKSVVAIIPKERYQSMKKKRDEFFRMVDEIREGMTAAEDSVIDTEIFTAVHTYRKKVSAISKKK